MWSLVAHVWGGQAERHVWNHIEITERQMRVTLLPAGLASQLA